MYSETQGYISIQLTRKRKQTHASHVYILNTVCI